MTLDLTAAELGVVRIVRLLTQVKLDEQRPDEGVIAVGRRGRGRGLRRGQLRAE